MKTNIRRRIRDILRITIRKLTLRRPHQDPYAIALLLIALNIKPPNI